MQAKPFLNGRTYSKKEEITGEIIKLKKTKYSHAQSLYAILVASDVLENLTIEINTLKDYMEYIRFTDHQWQLNQDLTYTIMLLDDTILGQISLYNISFIHYRAEIGIWLGKQFQHQGFGTIALEMIINFAFKSLFMNRLQAHMFIENEGSQKLFQKLGFKREGLLRQYVKKNEIFKDVYCYSALSK